MMVKWPQPPYHQQHTYLTYFQNEQKHLEVSHTQIYNLRSLFWLKYTASGSAQLLKGIRERTIKSSLMHIICQMCKCTDYITMSIHLMSQVYRNKSVVCGAGGIPLQLNACASIGNQVLFSTPSWALRMRLHTHAPPHEAKVGMGLLLQYLIVHNYMPHNVRAPQDQKTSPQFSRNYQEEQQQHQSCTMRNSQVCWYSDRRVAVSTCIISGKRTHQKGRTWWFQWMPTSSEGSKHTVTGLFTKLETCTCS